MQLFNTFNILFKTLFFKNNKIYTVYIKLTQEELPRWRHNFMAVKSSTFKHGKF